jgi:hypothetical protein
MAQRPFWVKKIPMRDVRQHMKTATRGGRRVNRAAQQLGGCRRRTVPGGLGLADVSLKRVVPGQIVVACATKKFCQLQPH